MENLISLWGLTQFQPPYTSHYKVTAIGRQLISSKARKDPWIHGAPVFTRHVQAPTCDFGLLWLSAQPVILP